ncbi:hypothetical protein RvY_12419 [Ramazzottius varieornatus]|uniref:Uncharacterized protein n=1 Tax=Ramazzottius varieornatus TaxID=947166 RepID=A0A1D1VJH9_RAMVA|nr:hypothetical protein RvY_12419 [Ramazzottius varieornatus]
MPESRMYFLRRSGAANFRTAFVGFPRDNSMPIICSNTLKCRMRCSAFVHRMAHLRSSDLSSTILLAAGSPLTFQAYNWYNIASPERLFKPYTCTHRSFKVNRDYE